MNIMQTHYWDRFVDEHGAWKSDKRPPGEDLAALRRGIGNVAGTVPAMWRFHHVAVPEDRMDNLYVDRRYEGEHHALTLFAVHQQSQLPSSPPVHMPGVGVGKALRALHAGDGASGAIQSKGVDASKAIDRRFYAAVTATSTEEVAHHLRGLIRMLRATKRPSPLDYSRLAVELGWWGDSERRDRIRRSWGLQYHARTELSPEAVPGEKPPPSDTPKSDQTVPKEI